MWMRSGHTGVVRLNLSAGGTSRGSIYANNSNNVGFLDNGGNWKLRVVSADYTLSDGSSMRAPLFYDSNNTSYYVDPATTSNINLLQTAGYIQLTGSDSHIYGGTITSRQGARFIDVGYSGSCYIEANRTGSGNSTILFGAATNGTGIWSRVGTTNGGVTHSSSPRQFTITMGTTVEFTMATNGVMSGDFNDTSDVLFKKNIANHSYGLAAVNTLKPREFNWKRNTRPQGKQVGFIAQEVEEIIPEVVHGYDGAKSINGTGLISVLTKAIQELSQQVTDLKAEVELLKQ